MWTSQGLEGLFNQAPHPDMSFIYIYIYIYLFIHSFIYLFIYNIYIYTYIHIYIYIYIYHLLQRHYTAACLQEAGKD